MKSLFNRLGRKAVKAFTLVEMRDSKSSQILQLISTSSAVTETL